MSNVRLLDPVFGDDLETAMRRFFSPTLLERQPRQLEMRIDVSEKEGAYVVKADIPGVKKEDINVRVDGNLVQIDAEVKQEKETKGDGDKVLRSERYYGSLSRAFTLGQDIDDANVKANYADGVLTLSLPKKTTAASKKITIQ